MWERKINRLLILLGALFLAFILVACSSADDKTEADGETTDADTQESGDSTGSDEPKDGGDLIIGLPANPTTLDPIRYEAIYESQVLSSVGNTLVVFNKELDEFIPALATDWEISDDL